MQAGHPDAVMELIDAGADLNLRDPEGNGWLHWAIESGQSTPLTLLGLARLDAHWHEANQHGLTPFHLPAIPLAVGQAMGVRFWAERRSWSSLLAHGDPVALAEANGHPQLASAWRYWRARCKA